MAAPVDANRVLTNFATGVRPWVINLPTGIVAGDLLIAVGRGGGAITTLLPTGWSWLMQNDSSDASDDTVSVIYKWADGTEGTTLSWDMGFAIKGASIAWRITGAANPATRAPEITSAIFATTANTANPPAITPTGGSKDYLFIAIASKDGVGNTTAAPSGYSNLTVGTSTGSGGAATNCTVAGATKLALAATTEDPGVFTHVAATTGGVAYTIAVHPAPTPKIETLTDTFDTAVDKTVKWSDSNAATVWDASARAKLPCGTTYSLLATRQANPGYDLTGSGIFAKLTVPALGTGTRELWLDVLCGTTNQNKFSMVVSGSTLIARKTIGGTNSGQNSVTYDPVAHAWWRIRESGGTIFFDTSPDSSTWTNLYSTTSGLTITSCWVSFSCGYFGTETADNGYVDNVNVAVAAPTPISGTDANGTTTEFGSVVTKTSVSDSDAGVLNVENVGIRVGDSDAGVLNVEAVGIRVGDSDVGVLNDAAVGIKVGDTDAGVVSTVTLEISGIQVVDPTGPETETASFNAAITGTDSSTGTDSASVNQGAQPVSAADANGTTTESISMVAPVFVTDANGFTETVALRLSALDANAVTTESGILVYVPASTDANSATSEIIALKLAGVDVNGVTTDSATVAVPLLSADVNSTTSELGTNSKGLLSATDASGISENASTGTGSAISATDANSTTTEFVKYVFALAVSDVGHAAEISSLALSFLSTDTGTGSENYTVGPISYFVIETAFGTDTQTLFREGVGFPGTKRLLIDATTVQPMLVGADKGTAKLLGAGDHRNSLTDAKTVQASLTGASAPQAAVNDAQIEKPSLTGAAQDKVVVTTGRIGGSNF